uniref:Uncharacterized protein n=1 Tax=Lutzomyia longipalpis TaxID=7200 RepID=A0A1B0CG86_LUTLO
MNKMKKKRKEGSQVQEVVSAQESKEQNGEICHVINPIMVCQ